MGSEPRVDLGRIVATPGAVSAVDEAGQDLGLFLSRHRAGDWGDVSVADGRENDQSLTTGGRLLSAYVTSTGTKIWVITEHDRSLTTILLPEDY